MGNSVGNTRQWAGSPSFLVDGVSGAFLLIPVVPSPPPPIFSLPPRKDIQVHLKAWEAVFNVFTLFFLSGHAPLLGKF